LAALEAMHSYNPDMRVNVVGIIDVTQLYEIAYDTITPHQLPDGTYLKCQDVWAAYNICPNALLNGDESRDAVQEQVKQYNKILKKGAHEYGYTYTNDLYKGEMGIEDVSMLDCFHPNIAGQNKIAELSWKQSVFSVDED
jgi:lysophospholipase L1-like esterase